jgi:hypothetical protein
MSAWLWLLLPLPRALLRCVMPTSVMAATVIQG